MNRFHSVPIVLDKTQGRRVINLFVKRGSVTVVGTSFDTDIVAKLSRIHSLRVRFNRHYTFPLVFKSSFIIFIRRLLNAVDKNVRTPNLF